MSSAEIFVYGFCGSAAMEIVAALPIFHNQPIVFPERYKRVSFWIVRFLLAVIAGGLAVVYDVQTRVLAVNVGASAPLLLQALGQGIRPANPNP